MARLKDLYKSKITNELKSTFNYTNVMAIPRVEKVVVSMGVGRAIQDKRILEAARGDLTMITGQKPVICKAKRSVSNFKLREGMDIGLKVTMRGTRMYEFLDRLINLAIPRVRDFRGLNPKGFDGRGNYSMGVTEQSIFPEVNLGKVEYQLGMNVTIVTTAKTDEEARKLLQLFGMPFRDLAGMGRLQ
jgi:large subunit ribosomal protein L5